ncbi:MAG: LUD domain-containing protein [Deltaproteobacteria bacterium]|nr:LUD domain-containing protein [Deltaproteobacteria bacterium]
MNSKQKILERIRKGILQENQLELPTRAFKDPTRGWDLEKRLHRFQDELSQLRGESFVVRSAEELRHPMKAIVQQAPPGPILLAESVGMESIHIREWICDQDSEHFVITRKTIQKKDGIKAALGITEADCGIAETGTLIFKSSPSSPLVFSLWPRTHIAILSAKRLYGSLEQALTADPQISQGHTVMVTGPSRTADIEKTLVLGMHAPQKLYVFILLD